ncbi:hypothetical protein [Microbulbifer epialgicus]|uniref:Uncharacterized protein n=1 Tax=Microbulbifer epialgicus TaxID=393907 RepID=A0ABV4NTE5_9GAMM
MLALDLLPSFIKELATKLDIDGESKHETIIKVEALVKLFNKRLSSNPGAQPSLNVNGVQTLFIAISAIHLHYSLTSDHDLNYISDVCAELSITKPTHQSISRIFQRICEGMKMSEYNRHQLQEAFARNRSTQIEDLLSPIMVPARPIFYHYC